MLKEAMSNKNKFDRTLVAVKRQLKAMACDYYEVGLYHREIDKMLPRFWTEEQVIKSVPWLKAQNFNGHDIFIRPKGSQGLVFFDDLDRATIDLLKSDGLAPAIIIESSPLNFHGWIRVSDKPITETLSTAVCKVIAKSYRGDKDSADWRHYGRLAGFTNRKPEHIQANGHHPFVILSEANGKLCDKAESLLSDGQKMLETLEKERSERRQRIANQVRSENLKKPIEFFQSQLKGLVKRYGTNLDASRADWMIVTKMLELGYSEGEIRQALEVCSLALESRLSHADQYIDVTLANASGRNEL